MNVYSDIAAVTSVRTPKITTSTGNIILQTYRAPGFGRLQFGGTTNAFPALIRNSTSLCVKLADNSAFARLEVGDLVVHGTQTGGGGGGGSQNISDVLDQGNSAEGQTLQQLGILRLGATNKITLNDSGIFADGDDIVIDAQDDNVQLVVGSNGTISFVNGNAVIGNNGSYQFNNGSYLGKGANDYGLGGNYGISMVCSVGFELNWQAGRLRCYSGETNYPIYSDSSIEINSTGEGGYGYTQFRINTNTSEVGLSLQNTGTSGREYRLFSTNAGSELGTGCFVIADATASANRLTITPTGEVHAASFHGSAAGLTDVPSASPGEANQTYATVGTPVEIAPTSVTNTSPAMCALFTESLTDGWGNINVPSTTTIPAYAFVGGKVIPDFPTGTVITSIVMNYSTEEGDGVLAYLAATDNNNEVLPGKADPDIPMGGTQVYDENVLALGTFNGQVLTAEDKVSVILDPPYVSAGANDLAAEFIFRGNNTATCDVNLESITFYGRDNTTPIAVWRNQGEWSDEGTLKILRDKTGFAVDGLVLGSIFADGDEGTAIRFIDGATGQTAARIRSAAVNPSSAALVFEAGSGLQETLRLNPGDSSIELNGNIRNLSGNLRIDFSGSNAYLLDGDEVVAVDWIYRSLKDSLNAERLRWHEDGVSVFGVLSAYKCNLSNENAGRSIEEADKSKFIVVDTNSSAAVMTLTYQATVGTQVVFVQNGGNNIEFTADSAGATIVCPYSNTYRYSSRPCARVEATVIANSDGSSAVWLLTGDLTD